MGGASPVGNTTINFNHPVILAQANNNVGEVKEQDHVQSQDEIKQKKSLGVFWGTIKGIWGFLKGFVKEAISIAFFIPKLLFNLVTDPVNTVKGFANGFLALGKLLFSPSELIKALGNAWEQFKAADSDQKGQVIGRILANITTVPLAGNPLLLNARLISSCKRFFVGRSAITANADVLSRFQSITGSRWKTFLAGRKIAKRANLQRDFERALKLERISAELAPRLAVTKKMPATLIAMYEPGKHLISVNKLWLDILPTRFISFMFPGMENIIGTFIRHEVKHAGQALLAARAGGALPFVKTAFGQSIPFMPQHLWDRAYQLSSLRPGTKFYNRARQIPGQFEASFQCTSSASTFGGSFWGNYRNQRRYMKDPLEVEAVRAQMRYTGLVPAIPTPSIYNLLRLAPLLDKEPNKKLENSNNDIPEKPPEQKIAFA